MRTIDANITAEIEKEVFSYFFSMELQFNTTFYYSNANIPVYISGQKYTPLDFELPEMKLASALSVDNITIKIANVDLGFSSILLNEDVRNKVVIVSFGAMTKYGGVIGVEEIFRGLISDWIIEETYVTINVVNELILWRKKPLRSASSSCPWLFKGTECTYAGAELWCDQTYDRCRSLNNDLNYGGFRFLPSIAEKQIWWGNTPRK